MVAAPTAHYLLTVDVLDGESPRWRFRLESQCGRDFMEASDVETTDEVDRLALLALVRGLEALDQPTRVSLICHNAAIRRGLSYGLDEWRDNGWQWERFGEFVPVKNADLWQRVDGALKFHIVENRAWRVDPAHEPAAAATAEEPASSETAEGSKTSKRRVPRPKFLDRVEAAALEEAV